MFLKHGIHYYLSILSDKTATNYKENTNYTVFEPVDEKAFNFTKIDRQEIVSLITHSEEHRNTKIFYNLLSNDDLTYLKQYDFNNKDYDTDIIIRNIYPIAHFHMLLLFDYYKILPQYINNERILFKVLNFIANCEDKDLM